jgi:hypothetical protein
VPDLLSSPRRPHIPPAKHRTTAQPLPHGRGSDAVETKEDSVKTNADAVETKEDWLKRKWIGLDE